MLMHFFNVTKKTETGFSFSLKRKRSHRKEIPAFLEK